jgi:hypothetical protein
MKHRNEASNPNTTHARLRELAKQSPELALVILKNPNTPPELTAQLRRQLNGKSPTDATDAETLELLREEALTQSNPTRLVWLAQFGGEITRAVARNPYTPKKCLRQLASHLDLLVRCELLRNPMISSDEINCIPKNNKGFVLRALAACEKTPLELLLSMTSHKNQKVVESVAQNPSMTLQGMIALWLNRKNRAVRLMEAAIKQRDDERSKRLAPWIVRLRGLARTSIWKAPIVQQELAKEACSAELRETLLQVSQIPNLYLSEKDLKELVTGDSSIIPLQLTQSYYATQEYLSSQISNKDPKIRLQVAQSYRTSPKDLEKLATDVELAVRLAVAKNYQTPPEALLALAKDNNLEMRLLLAQSYRLPVEGLESLSGSSYQQVRLLIAQSPQTTPQILQRLATDPEREVRLQVVKRPEIPESALLLLAKDQELTIRVQVAAHPRSTTPVLEQLAMDPQAPVRLRVVMRPSCGAKVLARLTKDKEVQIRKWVARHPKSNQEALAILGKDRSKYVRLEVAKNKKARPRTLERLLRDRVPEIQQATQETLQKKQENKRA